jgi:hypothetical protein
MIVLTRIYHKSWLILPIRDAKSLQRTEHHLGCLHEIKHHVLQLRHQRLLIDDVKVYLVFANNLDPNVSFDKIDLPSRIVEFIILVPMRVVPVFFELFLEKEDGTRRASN